MIALIKLLGRTYYKSPSWITGYIIPALFLAIFSTIPGSNLTSSVSIVVTMTLINQGITMFGFNLIELRKSVIFKRIGSTAITKPMAMMAFFIWAFISTGFIIIYIFLLTWIFDATNLSIFDWDIVNWAGVIPMIFVGLAVSLALSFLFVTISKNVETFTMYELLYFLLATFVGGIFFPGPNPEWMIWVGKFIPHVYVSDNFVAAFQGQNIYNIVEGYNITVGFISATDLPSGVGTILEFTSSSPVPKDVVEKFNLLTEIQNGWDSTIINGLKPDYSNFVDFFTLIEGDVWQFRGEVIGQNTVSTLNANITLWVPLGSTVVAFALAAKLFKWDA